MAQLPKQIQTQMNRACGTSLLTTQNAAEEQAGVTPNVPIWDCIQSITESDLTTSLQTKLNDYIGDGNYTRSVANALGEITFFINYDNLVDVNDNEIVDVNGNRNIAVE